LYVLYFYVLYLFSESVKNVRYLWILEIQFHYSRANGEEHHSGCKPRAKRKALVKSNIHQ
jgi:hypothetical protein